MNEEYTPEVEIKLALDALEHQTKTDPIFVQETETEQTEDAS